MMNLIRTLRNNWKKTIFFAVVGYAGTDYANERYRAFVMMRELALEAHSHGKRPLPRGARTKHITLLLNPVANNRKGRDHFESYAEPLIHLSGFLVNIVKTEKISEARELVELIEKTNIIAVAGGDGTLMEVVTGLLRRGDAEEAVRRFPIAVIPVGTRNSFAASFLDYNAENPKDAVAQAAMNITRHHIEPEDVIKVELISPTTISESKILNTEDSPVISDSDESLPTNEIGAEADDLEKKPYYSMGGLRLGQFLEARKREDDMPRFLNRKLRTLWSHFRTPVVKCKAELRYLPYCDGCSRCKEERLKKHEPQRSFFQRVVSVFRPSVYAAQHHVAVDKDPKWERRNPSCGNWESLCVDTPELNILAKGNGKLEIQVGKEFSKADFLREGFRRRYEGLYDFSSRISCQEVELFPLTSPENYSIDNEDFPVKPIRMQVLPNKVYFFTPRP